MAFCPNCGTQTPGVYCPNCGAAVAGQSAPPPPNASPQYHAEPLNMPGISDNVAGALCYFGAVVTGIIFLVLAPYNQSKFVRFHAFQSIFITIAWMAILFVLGVLSHGFIIFLYPLIGLGGVALWLYMMFTAFNDKKFKLPIIGDLAEKQA